MSSRPRSGRARDENAGEVPDAVDSEQLGSRRVSPDRKPEDAMNPTHRAAERLPDVTEDQVGTVYGHLRDLTVRGRLPPGSPVIEARLAERLGTSRTPVRAALKRLEQEGFFELTSGSGGRSRRRVTPLTERDARELLSLLGSVEGLAAGWSARMPRQERRSLVEALRSVNDRLREEIAGEQPDPERVFGLDSEFHLGLVAADCGRRLRRLHRSCRLQAERYVRHYLYPRPERVGRIAREHEAILEAVEAGEPEAAGEAAEECWQKTAERLVPVIEQAGERGSW